MLIRRISFGLAMPFVFGAFIVNADAEIHRCMQPDGTVSFQETPCPTDVETPGEESGTVTEDAPSDESTEWVNPYDLPGEAPAPVESAVPLPSEDRAECERLTRDAIDAIDRELQQGYSSQEGEEHKARLLELTRQLRNCKTL